MQDWEIILMLLPFPSHVASHLTNTHDNRKIENANAHYKLNICGLWRATNNESVNFVIYLFLLLIKHCFTLQHFKIEHYRLCSWKIRWRLVNNIHLGLNSNELFVSSRCEVLQHLYCHQQIFKQSEKCHHTLIFQDGSFFQIGSNHVYCHLFLC